MIEFGGNDPERDFVNELINNNDDDDDDDINDDLDELLLDNEDDGEFEIFKRKKNSSSVLDNLLDAEVILKKTLLEPLSRNNLGNFINKINLIVF